MKVKVRLTNDVMLWGDNPYIEIEMPYAPQLDQHMYLGQDNVEKLITAAIPYFHKIGQSIPHVWDLTFVFVTDVLWDVMDNCYSCCISDKPYEIHK